MELKKIADLLEGLLKDQSIEKYSLNVSQSENRN